MKAAFLLKFSPASADKLFFTRHGRKPNPAEAEPSPYLLATAARRTFRVARATRNKRSCIYKLEVASEKILAATVTDPQEAADYLGIDIRTVGSIVKRGELRPVRILERFGRLPDESMEHCIADKSGAK